MAPTSGKQASARDMAERIRARRPVVIERWVRRAYEELPAARGQDRTALIDSLPVLLGELADALTDEPSREESTFRAEMLGKVHGLTRALTDAYDVDQVRHEYEILHDVLLPTLDEGSPLSPELRGVVVGTIQQASQNATAEFARQRESEQQKVEGKALAMAGEVANREHMFDTMLGATPDHIFAFDLAGRLIYVNEAATGVHARPRRELIGLTVREFWPDTAPIAQFEENLRRASRGEHVVQEHRFPTPTGVRQFEYTLSPMRNDQGEIEAVVGIRRDIEERKQAELERDRFFQLTPDMFCIAGTDGYLKRVNPAFTETLGWSEAELLSQPFLAFIHPDDAASTLAQLKKASGGERAFRFENRYRRKDGAYRWLTWSTAPMPEQGVMYAAARDITDVKEAQAERDQRAQFEQQLIGIVSHDLRNPISAIVLGTQALLRREDLDDRTLRALVRLNGSADRAGRMIRDLLDFTQARLGSGIPVRCSPVDLHALVSQTVAEVETATPGRTLLHRAMGDGHGNWDPDRMAQVVTNLVANALKYSPEETPVTIETRGEGRTVRLSIHNEGEPIPADRLGRLFEPLQRATTQTDVAGRSIGLGLYIVKKIVDAHGGTIGVESAEGVGTTFTITLPKNACHGGVPV